MRVHHPPPLNLQMVLSGVHQISTAMGFSVDRIETEQILVVCSERKGRIVDLLAPVLTHRLED